MSIGIVSSDEFEAELDRADRSPVPELRPAQVIDINRGGRSEGDNNVPDSLRKIIGEEAVINGRSSARAFAKGFGISDSSVSAYTDSKTSTAAVNKNTKLVDHLNGAKLRVALKAKKKLHAALDNITDNKLEDLKAVDLAQVAKAMSGIIKDMTPEEKSDSGNQTFNGPSIVLFNPGFNKESNFETVESQE